MSANASDFPVDKLSAEVLVEEVVRLCERAGHAILGVYQQPALDIDYKADQSPVTAADLAAQAVLLPGLRRLLPDVPVLSEEADVPAFDVRRHWHLYWLVDPLDGTREFISGNGEFTVNVALIHEGQPVLGVVHAPTQKLSYSGLRGVGAFRYSVNARRAIRTRKVGSRVDAGLPLEVVISRRHGLEATAVLMERLRARFGSVDQKDVGSSLKFCLLAEGEADLYPRLAPTCEWDTAAAQAVVEAAGGAVLDGEFQRLSYNQKDSLLNLHFFAVADKDFCWSVLLANDNR